MIYKIIKEDAKNEKNSSLFFLHSLLMKIRRMSIDECLGYPYLKNELMYLLISYVLWLKVILNFYWSK
jgi:hypothetical protein